MFANSLPLVSVGILHVNETSLPECLRNVDAQEGVNVERVIFSRHPAREAHELLYRYFNHRRQGTRALAKVDADMVLTNRRVFSATTALFEAFPLIHKVKFPLFDSLLRSKIYGLNMWSPSVRWGEGVIPRLRTDGVPTSVTRQLTVPRDLVDVGLHAPTRTGLDACVFTTRRAAKVAELGLRSGHVKTLVALLEDSNLEASEFRSEIVGAIVLTMRRPNQAARAVQDPGAMSDWTNEASAVGAVTTGAEARRALEALVAIDLRLDSRTEVTRRNLHQIVLRKRRRKLRWDDTSMHKDALEFLLQSLQSPLDDGPLSM